MIIYKATNSVNGKIYIGQTCQPLKKRIWQHSRPKSKTYFSNALGKYGVESFNFVVIDESDNKDDLNEKEQFWISHYGCMIPNGYNMTNGGHSCRMSEESRKKIGKESRERIRKPCSEETKRKISIANMGKPSPAKGRVVSEETRDKIRKSVIARCNTEETKRRMSESHKGNVAHNKGIPMSDEQKQKLSKSHRDRINRLSRR